MIVRAGGTPSRGAWASVLSHEVDRLIWRLQHRVPHTSRLVYNSGNGASRADPARGPRRYPQEHGNPLQHEVRNALLSRGIPALLAAAGNTGFDYLALLCALRTVGAQPRPSLVVLAYTGAELLALIPLTPGGLGFVEAGLVGTLTLAGVSPADALLATLTYRLVSYWLPIPAGGVAYVAFRRRESASARAVT